MAYHLPKVGQVKINDIWFSYTHCMYALIFSLKVTSDYIPNKNNWLVFKMKLQQVRFKPDLRIV